MGYTSCSPVNSQMALLRDADIDGLYEKYRQVHKQFGHKLYQSDKEKTDMKSCIRRTCRENEVSTGKQLAVDEHSVELVKFWKKNLLVRNLQKERLKEREVAAQEAVFRDRCAICNVKPHGNTKVVMFDCGHAFCCKCAETHLYHEALRTRFQERPRCPTCRMPSVLSEADCLYVRGLYGQFH